MCQVYCFSPPLNPSYATGHALIIIITVILCLIKLHLLHSSWQMVWSAQWLAKMK